MMIAIAALILAGCGSVYSTVTNDPSKPLFVEEVKVKDPDDCGRLVESHVLRGTENSWSGAYHYNEDGTITCTIHRIL